VTEAALIVNPRATRVTPELTVAVERELRAGGQTVETLLTERPRHAADLAAEISGSVERLYVLGGDGAYNEVVNGVEEDVAVGFLPGGSTSVLPRALGLPRDPVAAARRLASARPRRISVGRVNGRRFGFSAGLGLDAELIRRVEALGRTSEGRRAGDVAFARTALALLWERRFRLEPALELVGLGRVAFALVANCDPYTYLGRVALHIAPQARFELGLDVVGPNAVTPSSIPRFLAYAVRGRGQERARDVFYGHDLDRVEAVCDRLPLQADGEDLGDVTEAVFEAERDAVAVLA
jgi:diacylglycerol kinase family enzyme